MNVRNLLVLLTALSISGCSALNPFSWFKKEDKPQPVVIQKQAVEKTRLNIDQPPPLSLRPLNWVIVTPENAERIWKELKEKDTDLVLFGLTDDGYQKLAMNIAEIRTFINTQRMIIIKYKEYYEPPLPKPDANKDKGNAK